MTLRETLKRKLSMAFSASMVIAAVVAAPIAGSELAEAIHGPATFQLDMPADSDSDTEWFVVDSNDPSYADMVEAGVIEQGTECKVTTVDGDTAHTVCDNGYEEWS